MHRSIFLVCSLLSIIVTVSAREKQNRIFGGNRATAKVRKHLAKVKTIFRDSEGDATCSGSIVGNKWLLSAAHCFTEPDDTYARVKRSYAYIAPEVARPEDDKKYFFQDVYLPTGWIETRHNRYDIALVKLQDEIEEDKRNPVKIGAEPYPDKRVIVAGFGVLSEGDDEEWPDYPMQAKKFSKDIQFCKKRQDEEANQAIDPEFHVCTVSINFPESKTDMCSGDSGGPIFRKRNGKLQQYAVHAFAFDSCGTAGEPSYSIRLTAYQDAIENIMENGSDPDWETI